MAFSPDGRTLAASDHTGGRLVLIDPTAGRITAEVPLRGEPAGLCWSRNGERIYVALRSANAVAELDAAGRALREIQTAAWPVDVALTPAGEALLASCAAADAVVLVSLADGQQLKRIPAVRQPWYLALGSEGRTAVVGNRLPAGDALRPEHSAAVSVIDLDRQRVDAEVVLPANSTNVLGTAVGPKSRFAYVVHNLGRAMLPTEQIEYGWINANALSIIDLKARRRYATVLLDRPERGAADPWGVAVAPDGGTLWITLSGTHQLARLDLDRLHEQLARLDPKLRTGAHDAAMADQVRAAVVYAPAGRTGASDPGAVELVISERPVAYGQGLYLGGIIRRFELIGGRQSSEPVVPSETARSPGSRWSPGSTTGATFNQGNGPRGLAISPGGRRLAAAMYYSGSVVLIDTARGTLERVVQLPGPGQPDLVRRGEMIFHDARYCYQQWLSCATCHPEGRSDGLNWDLLNDGIGSQRNTRSLVLAARTPPAMSRGVRPNMEAAAEAGFRFLLFLRPAEEDLRAVQAYLRALEPEPSPHGVFGLTTSEHGMSAPAPSEQGPRLGGPDRSAGPQLAARRLTDKARRGQTLFLSPRTRCAACHAPPLFTDLKMHDVGTGGERESDARFDTPTLIECWRTAPYLHDGRAPTLEAVFTRFNPQDRHGHTAQLSAEEVSALVEFLRSL